MAAATYADLYTLLTDGPTRQRVEVACIHTAYNVSNEDPGTTNHTNRLAWARATLNDPVTAATHAVFFVVVAFAAANPTFDLPGIVAGLTDAAIQSQVDASLSIFAS